MPCSHDIGYPKLCRGSNGFSICEIVDLLEDPKLSMMRLWVSGKVSSCSVAHPLMIVSIGERMSPEKNILSFIKIKEIDF